MLGRNNNNKVLLGVALGAVIVGTTLVLRDVFEDPKNREAVRRTVSSGCAKVKQGYAATKKKVEEGVATAKAKMAPRYAAAKTKVKAGVATVREKAEERGEEIRAVVRSIPVVQKIRDKVDDLRHVADDPIEEYFREDGETVDADEITAEEIFADDVTEEPPAEDAPAEDATAVWDTPDE